MQTKINDLKKYIEQMKQERDEAICITEARQQDMNAAFSELEKLKHNALVNHRRLTGIDRNFQEDMINNMDMGQSEL